MNFLDLAYVFAALITAPVWARKARGDWPSRFGRTEQLPPSASQSRPRILLHAVSVGEVNAIRALVPALAERAEVVISVGTDTGIARARALFDNSQSSVARVVRYPLDFSRSVRRFLDAVKPDAVGLVELELWPNFLRECTRRSIPVAVVNGRLSDRSFKGYHRFRYFFRRSFASLKLAAVQDASYADRFIAMGVPPEKCVITGTMKWDAVSIADVAPGADDLARDLGIDRSRPLIVAGSTAEDEESMLHHACPPGVQLLCAPRKPEHFAAAAAAMPGCIRRSDRSTSVTGAPMRFLLDTIGELRAAYALADVVVIGRSFGTLHGSDPIEPIGLGKAVVIGPAHRDFLTTVNMLAQARGIQITTAADLPKVLTNLLESPEDRAALARNGRECILAHQGATRRHADLLLSLTTAERTTSIAATAPTFLTASPSPAKPSGPPLQ